MKTIGLFFFLFFSLSLFRVVFFSSSISILLFLSAQPLSSVSRYEGLSTYFLVCLKVLECELTKGCFFFEIESEAAASVCRMWNVGKGGEGKRGGVR